MRRLKDRTYVGAPEETVTVTRRVEGGGQQSATLDGVPLPRRSVPAAVFGG